MDKQLQKITTSCGDLLSLHHKYFERTKRRSQFYTNVFIISVFFVSTILTLKSQNPMPGVGPWQVNVNAQTQTFNDVCIGFASPLNVLPESKVEIKYKPCLIQQYGLVVTSLGCTISDNLGTYSPNYNIIDAVLISVDPNLPDPPYIPAAVSFSPSFTITSALVPLVNQNKQPIFWVRDENIPSGLPGTPGFATYNSKFIVQPNGSTGINTNNPRATLDVVQTGNGYNSEATAVFAKHQQGTSTPLFGGENGTVSAGVNGFRTKQIMVFNSLRLQNYNRIVQEKDQAILFSDGLNSDGSNLNGALVIAPWASDYQNPTSTVGGIRIDKTGGVEIKGHIQGNLEVRGKVRASELTVNAQWWPDFVFSRTYNLMPLNEVKSFIVQHGHLPGMPSQDSIISTGQDLGNLQRLQQQKIEELTLYTIQQNEVIQKQDETLKYQEARLKALEEKLNLLTK